MKIAFVNDTFIKSRGADHVVFELARRMGRDHDVTVLTFKSDFPEESFKIKKIEGEKLLTGTWKDFLFLGKLLTIRKATKGYDIVSLHHSFLGLALLGRKRVITFHGTPGMNLAEKSIIRKIFRKLASIVTTFLLRYSSKVVAISKYMRGELIKLGVPNKKIEVIYNGSYEKTEKSNIKKDFMFYVGRLETHKQVDQLIDIAKDTDFDLVIAGGGPEKENLEKKIKESNAPVKLLGIVSEEEKIKLYQNCSFFVSASGWEGFGLPFIEAAKFGKPSIGYDVGSVSEVIKDKETGFLVKDIKNFTEKTKKLINNNELREKLGDNAFKFSQNFSWDKTAGEYEKLFKDITKKPHTR